MAHDNEFGVITCDDCGVRVTWDDLLDADRINVHPWEERCTPCWKKRREKPVEVIDVTDDEQDFDWMRVLGEYPF